MRSPALCSERTPAAWYIPPHSGVPPSPPLLQLAMAETPLSLVAEELQSVTDAAKTDSVGIMYIDHARYAACSS